MEDIMVTIMCNTYNQADYIRQALDSFIMQKTSFKFKVFVHDDASTDGTTEIVKEYEKKYPDIIKGFYETENQFSQGKGWAKKTFDLAHSKYIAICEGDDFWTDTQKLQLQVDYLEKHEECSVCVCAAYYVNRNSEIQQGREFRPYNESRTVTTDEIIRKWLFPTNSIVYRKAMRKCLVVPFRGNCKSGDYALMVYLSVQGSVYYINKPMCAYRVNAKGSLSEMHRKNVEKARQFNLSKIEMADRLDEYLNYQYHDAVMEFKEREKFAYWLTYPNLKEAKKFKNLYKELRFKTKVSLYIKAKSPRLYVLIAKLRGIRNDR